MSESFFIRRCPQCNFLIEVMSEAQKVALQMLCMDMEQQRDWPAGSWQHISAKKWKQLLILAWERDHEREAEILPAIDGDNFDIVFRRPDRLTKDEASEVLAFGNAWAAENGVVRTKSRRQIREEQEALAHAHH